MGSSLRSQPSTAMFTPAATVSLVGSMCFGLVMISARVLRSTPGISMIFWQTLSGVIVGAAIVPFSWADPSPIDWVALVASGVFSMLAHVAVNWAFKLTDAVVIAPFQYTQLFWAVVYGWFVFGDFPSTPKFIGAAMIVLSGLFIFMRERQLKVSSAVIPAIHD